MGGPAFGFGLLCRLQAMGDACADVCCVGAALCAAWGRRRGAIPPAQALPARASLPAPCLVPPALQIYGSPHPGVQMHPSSGGKKLMTLGRGDDTASWAVVDLQLRKYVRAAGRLRHLVVGGAGVLQTCGRRPCSSTARPACPATPAPLPINPLEQTVGMSKWYAENSHLPSHPDDPAPLMPAAAGGSQGADGAADEAALQAAGAGDDASGMYR